MLRVAPSAITSHLPKAASFGVWIMEHSCSACHGTWFDTENSSRFGRKCHEVVSKINNTNKKVLLTTYR